MATKKKDKSEASEKAAKPAKSEKPEKPEKAEKAAKTSDKGAEKAPEPEVRERPRLPTAEDYKPKKVPPKQARGGTSQATVYQQAQSYKVGEVIFHPVWKVEGTVMEVNKTTDGHSRIVVDFQDLGVKRLITEYVPIKAE